MLPALPVFLCSCTSNTAVAAGTLEIVVVLENDSVAVDNDPIDAIVNVFVTSCKRTVQVLPEVNV